MSGRHAPTFSQLLLLGVMVLAVSRPSACGQAQPSQEDLRQRFLRAREKMRTERSPQERTDTSPAPASDPTPSPAPKPSPKPAAPPTPSSTPASSATPRRSPSAPKPSRPPPTPRTLRRESPPSEARRAPIIIEKLGESPEEPEPSPSPTPETKRKGWWIFGRKEPGQPRYKFLTSPIRKQIDAPKIRRGRWKYVVVHNSGSRNGNAKIFDYYHRRVRKMRNGMAYHFVIGNGSASGDGRIEIGDRWRRQINGGHVASDYLNNIAIGICLVGDFNRDLPTQNQLDALRELIDYLRDKTGSARKKKPIVKAHRDINPKPTDCPGNRWYRTRWLQKSFY